MKSMFVRFNSLAFLMTISYWVCEKSDGVRVLVFVRREDNTSAVYLVCSLSTRLVFLSVLMPLLD